MIVLILVAVLWIAVLIPSVISRLSERRSAGSIDHFHQRLDLLERTGPKLVSPAYSLTGTGSVTAPTVPLVVAAPPPVARPNLTLVPPVEGAAWSPGAFGDEPPPVPEYGLESPRSTAEADDSAVAEPSLVEQEKLVAHDRRQLARKRRRDVFGLLCALTALSGLVGLVRPLRGAWIASAVFAALLVAFVGLAVYGQRVEAERRHLRELRRAGQARDAEEAVDSGVVKYLSEEELAQYYEAEDARLVAEG